MEILIADEITEMATTKVVILNWNGVDHLKAFLPSVVATTPERVGIVVADNGSTDNSLEYVSATFPRVEIVRLDRNYGFAEGYNRALKQVESDYYVLLNSDVETTDGWCERLIEAMDNDPQMACVAPKIKSYSKRERFEYAGACGGFIDMLGYPFCRGRILSKIEKDKGQYDDPREVFWASGACLMFRAELFHKLGGFDEKFFAHMEEIDLCWRAQLYGYKVGVEPRSVVYHLGGGTLPNNTPKKIYLNYRNNLAMLYKNLPSGRKTVTLFVRMILDGLSAAVFLFTGKVGFFKAVWNAHFDFYKMKKELRTDRSRIQSEKCARAKNIYFGSIILRYALGKRKFKDMM